MNFHFITDSQMVVTAVPFGTDLPKLRVEDGDASLRPHYVHIDKEEVETAHTKMTEQQFVSYLKMIKKKLTFGGKVYLEVANYE